MWLKTGVVGLWISGQVDTGEGWGLFTPVRRHGEGGGGETNVFVRTCPIYVVACVTGFRMSCAFVAIVSQGVRPSRPYQTRCTGRAAPIGNPLRPSINAAPCYTAGSWCARLAARARVLESVLNADGSLSGRVVCEGTARPPCPPIVLVGDGQQHDRNVTVKRKRKSERDRNHSAASDRGERHDVEGLDHFADRTTHDGNVGGVLQDRGGLARRVDPFAHLCRKLRRTLGEDGRPVHLRSLGRRRLHLITDRQHQCEKGDVPGRGRSA